MALKKKKTAPSPKIITSVSVDLHVRKWFEQKGLSLTKVVNMIPKYLDELTALRQEVKDMAAGIKRKDELIMKQAATIQRLEEMHYRLRSNK